MAAEGLSEPSKNKLSRGTSCFLTLSLQANDCFRHLGGKKGMMINHRRNAVEELCCVYSVVFWRPRCVVSVSGSLVATWDASGCFSCAS